jgi:hypothetical protein
MPELVWMGGCLVSDITYSKVRLHVSAIEAFNNGPINLDGGMYYIF